MLLMLIVHVSTPVGRQAAVAVMLALMRLSSRPAMRPLFAQRLSSSSRAALIKELRARTSAPMKKCADALSEAGGDVEEAATLLRKAGLAAAQKKASRGASDGVAAVFWPRHVFPEIPLEIRLSE